MTYSSFFCERLGPHLQKKNTPMRETISVESTFANSNVITKAWDWKYHVCRKVTGATKHTTRRIDGYTLHLPSPHHYIS